MLMRRLVNQTLKKMVNWIYQESLKCALYLQILANVSFFCVLDDGVFKCC
jgi:hypothetical protein